MRVAILGTGPIGLGGAALLASRGHQPVLWSPSGGSVPALAAGAALEAGGALTGTYPVEVAADCAAAITGADAVFITLPANGHRLVMDAMLPHLAENQAVIVSGHQSFGALYLSKGLAARGLALPIIVWGTTVTTGRRTGPASVRIGSIRSKVDIATVPAVHAQQGLALCQMLFGERFVLRDDMIAIALSNLNPQNHLAITLCNLTRMERGEVWLQNENITDAVGRLIEALDAERLAIAAAFNLKVRTVREHFHLSFHVPQAPLGEMARAMAARGDATQAPATLDTRYVTEDAPFGLYPTVLLGQLAGRPAVLHESGIAMLSALYGRDLASENNLLPALGFETITVERLRQLAQSGWGD
jgi:opine dehydrogenase